MVIMTRVVVSVPQASEGGDGRSTLPGGNIPGREGFLYAFESE